MPGPTWGSATPTPSSGGAPTATPVFAASSGPTWGAATAPAPTGGSHGPGGILGTLENVGKTGLDLASAGLSGHFIGSGYLPSDHTVAQKIGLAAHDIAGIPGGLKTLAMPAVDNAKAAYFIVTGNMKAARSELNKAHNTAEQLKTGLIQSGETAVEHPGRDPFQTVTTLLPIAASGAGLAARAGLLADAARAGDIGAAARAVSPLEKVPVEPRIVNVPRNELVPPKTGLGPSALEQTSTPVQLHAARAPLPRLLQKAHDAGLQHVLSKDINTASDPGLLTRYARMRVRAVTNEDMRVIQRKLQVPAGLLQRAAFDSGVSRKVGNLALFLRSANVHADEAAGFWRRQANEGVNPAFTSKLADLAQQVHDQGLLTTDEHGNVEVNDAGFPKLAVARDRLAAAQQTREDIIREHGLMTDEGLQTRLNLIGRRINGENARLGRGYTPLKTSVKRPFRSAYAVSRSKITGRPRSFIESKEATGEGVVKGVVPDDTVGGVARALNDALRFTTTSEWRRLIARGGSDVKSHADDVLIRDPSVNLEREPKISDVIRQQLGERHSTLDTIPEEAHIGLRQQMNAYLHRVVPGLQDEFTRDRAAGLGTRAPEGYKWVPHAQLGDLAKAVTPRRAITRSIDSVNSAVTAMTVYFKVGHLTTRGFTNAFFNLVQGSATPTQIAKSIRLWRQLTDSEKATAIALTGGHGIEALPHEGVNLVARTASKGASWWARRIDSPFRFNALAYEADKAGFKTVAGFRRLLDHAGRPGSEGLDAAEAAKADWVVKHANRAAGMYDGLNAAEKAWLSRLFWFYPWTKAAVRFAGHTLAEHPYKSAGLAAAGVQGRLHQQNVLGAVPSYEEGLVPLGGGANPLTTSLSTFTPLGTSGDVLNALVRPGQISGFANPLAGAAASLAFGVDQYGNKTNAPYTSALGQVFSPTPEAQILAALLHHPKPTQTFQTTWLSALERAVAGPAYPRRVNPAALAKSHGREVTGR